MVCPIGGLPKCRKSIRSGDTFGGCWLLLILMMFQYNKTENPSKDALDQSENYALCKVQIVLCRTIHNAKLYKYCINLRIA